MCFFKVDLSAVIELSLKVSYFHLNYQWPIVEITIGEAINLTSV